MKRKRSGTIFMAAVLSAVSLAATPIVAHADHAIPGTGTNPKMCNNTYISYSHITMVDSYQIPKHVLSDGRSCLPTRYVYVHQKRCTSCGAVLGTSSFACEERHPVCGTVIAGMGH